MFKKFLAGAAFVGMLATAASASALTYTSQLEYQGTNAAHTPSFGTVTIDEVDANDVMVTVTLTNPGSLFVNTGGAHDPFLFSLLGSSDHVAVTDGPGQKFTYDGSGSFSATPFGTFTNKIGCCGGESKKGQANGNPPPLVFTVSNLGGMTFAGVGATFDSTTGRLLNQGTGNRFTSNAGGWWFSADIYDSGTGQTYNVAARDAFIPHTPGVPEPATWALMIMGFGGAGAMLRRRRPAVATAA
jgi:hypothetical protein